LGSNEFMATRGMHVKCSIVVYHEFKSVPLLQVLCAEHYLLS